MGLRYYIDTNIWVDLFLDRRGPRGEPLGIFAADLLASIKYNDGQIVVSDMLTNELEGLGLLGDFNAFTSGYLCITLSMDDHKYKDAQRLMRDFNLHAADAAHAVLAHDSDSILVTRDNHFRLVEGFIESFAPEDLI